MAFDGDQPIAGILVQFDLEGAHQAFAVAAAAGIGIDAHDHAVMRYSASMDHGDVVQTRQ